MSPRSSLLFPQEDPGDQQPLFPPDPKCASCGTTRPNLCQYEADQSEGIIDPYAPRPKTCLNSAQNRDGIPFP